ncbi:GNAT family N-acetyltransferase [Paenibacillus sp. y28]|uniref:GNAT family N-acetyltransferase n=1 Tax=Paenibacillus sp. y28 TaxID=3129110 RepID=UPI00301B4951
MTIRPATKQDADSAALLLYEAMHDIAHQLTGQSDPDDVLRVLADYFRQEDNRLSFRQALVKELDRQVAGIMVCYHGRDAERLDQPILDHLRAAANDPSIRLDQEADLDEFYIDTLSVSPAFGRRGIGRELLQAAELQAKRSGSSRIALVVDQDNEAAYSLYVKLGYEKDKMIHINCKPYRHMIKLL